MQKRATRKDVTAALTRALAPLVPERTPQQAREMAAALAAAGKRTRRARATVPAAVAAAAAVAVIAGAAAFGFGGRLPAAPDAGSGTTTAQPTAASTAASSADGTRGGALAKYVFTTARCGGTTKLADPPAGTVKQVWTLAELKERIGFDPVPAYLPAHDRESFMHDTDTQEVLITPDGGIYGGVELFCGRGEMFLPSGGDEAAPVYDKDHMTLSIFLCGSTLDYALSDDPNSQTIGGTPVELTRYADETPAGYGAMLRARFVYRDVPVTIETCGIEENEFIRILESLLCR